MKKISRIIFPVLMLAFILGMNVTLKAQYVSNYVAYFNGTSGYLSFNNTPESNLSNGYTIESWVYYQHVQGGMKCLFSNPEAGVNIQLNHEGRLSVSYAGSNITLDFFPFEKWTHLAVTYNGNQLAIFINGNVAFAGNMNAPILTTGPVSYVGALKTETGIFNYFKGYINDFRVWNRVKSQFEVNRDMHISLANPTPTGVYFGLGVSYKFDIYGTQFQDEGGYESNFANNHNVTISPYGNISHPISSYNSSLVLDGSTAYCVAPNFTKIHSNSFLTAEAWFKVQNAAPRNEVQTILSKGNTNAYSYKIALVNDTLLSFSVNAGGGYNLEASIQKPFGWNHVAGTYNAVSGKMNLYVNGILAASETMTPEQIVSSNNDSLYIGSDINTGNKFKGQIDELRLWGNTERTQQEIKQYMHQSINHHNQPLQTGVGVYSFEGKSSDASTENLSHAMSSLKFYGSAYMRSSRLSSEIYSTSPVIWHSMPNLMDNTWNFSKSNIDIPPSGIISDSIYFATDGAVLDPKVMIMLNTPNIHAVKIKLISPDGTTVQLTPDHSNASAQPDMMTILSDNGMLPIVYEENSLAPFSPYFKANALLSQFNGKQRQGWWKLKLEINNIGVESNLVRWGIQDNVVTEVPGNGEINLNSYKLDQNYPNPFNPSTKIKFELPADVSGLVKLSVYDITGKEVAVLANGALKPGAYEYTWNAEAFSSGVYFYTLKTKGGIITKKMLLVK